MSERNTRRGQLRPIADILPELLEKWRPQSQSRAVVSRSLEPVLPIDEGDPHLPDELRRADQPGAVPRRAGDDRQVEEEFALPNFDMVADNMSAEDAMLGDRIGDGMVGVILGKEDTPTQEDVEIEKGVRKAVGKTDMLRKVGPPTAAQRTGSPLNDTLGSRWRLRGRERAP
jgi:hypothetical protein